MCRFLSLLKMIFLPCLVPLRLILKEKNNNEVYEWYVNGNIIKSRFLLYGRQRKVQHAKKCSGHVIWIFFFTKKDKYCFKC